MPHDLQLAQENFYWCVPLVLEVIMWIFLVLKTVTCAVSLPKGGISRIFLQSARRPQRSGGFSLNLYLPGLSGWSGVTSYDMSRYIVISHTISFDITRYDISRYCIHLPNFRDCFRDILSRRDISRYRTHSHTHLDAPCLVYQGSKTKIWRLNSKGSGIYPEIYTTSMYEYV